MTVDSGTEPVVALTGAQRRARWERIREANRQIMADRLAAGHPDRGLTRRELREPRPAAVTVHAGPAAATASAAPRPPLAPPTQAVTVHAGLAAATATAAQPEAGDAWRLRRRAASRRWYARNCDAQRKRMRQRRQDNLEAARARDRDRDTDPGLYAQHLERNRRWKAARRAAVAIGANAGPAAGAGTALPPVPVVSAITR